MRNWQGLKNLMSKMSKTQRTEGALSVVDIICYEIMNGERRRCADDISYKLLPSPDNVQNNKKIFDKLFQ